MMQWTIVQLSPKPQMSKSRSSTICVVVERSDHHCGDDLVKSWLLSSYCKLSVTHVRSCYMVQDTHIRRYKSVRTFDFDKFFQCLSLPYYLYRLCDYLYFYLVFRRLQPPSMKFCCQWSVTQHSTGIIDSVLLSLTTNIVCCHGDRHVSLIDHCHGQRSSPYTA